MKKLHREDSYGAFSFKQALAGSAGHLALSDESLQPLGQTFQALAGSAGHLAENCHLYAEYPATFQALAGSAGHLACNTSSIAWEVDLCKGFRESLF